MTQPTTLSYFPIEKANSQDAKLWDEIQKVIEKHEEATRYERTLSPIFDALPDEDLLAALQETRKTGRPGFQIITMWHTMLAMYILNIPTYSQLIYQLQENPAFSHACGIHKYDSIPSKYAYSRFQHKLKTRTFVKMVRDVFRELYRILSEILPNLGKHIAIDSTTLKGFVNPGHTPLSDPDAGWSIKDGTRGEKEFCFGYKLHLMVDTTYEIPIAAVVTSGDVHDSKAASNVLSEARFTSGKFHPEYIICDAAYSGKKFIRLIKRQYRAEPIVKINPGHKKLRLQYPETKEWKKKYKERDAVERTNGKLKDNRRLNNITVRGKMKVTIHCYLSMMVVLAQYLSKINQEWDSFFAENATPKLQE